MADKKNISIRKLIFNDKYLIIFSLILALIVWVITSLNIGTDETKTITVDVPISLSDELSEQVGMKYYSLQDSVSVNVTISGAKYVIGQVDENDLSVKFDTSSVNRAGEQTIPILVTNNSKTLDFTVTSTYPSSIDAYFDIEATKTFDLYLTYDETNIADGYIFGTPVMSEDKITVSGPKTYVDKIDRAIVDVDFGDNALLTEPFNSECPITLDGSGVESSYITITPKSDTSTIINNVNVTLPVLKDTNLPIKVDFEEAPANVASDALKVEYSQDKLHVGVLDSANLTSATIGKISYEQLYTGKNEFTFDLNDVSGLTVLDNKFKEVKVTVTVDSSYKKYNVAQTASKVILEGVPEGYSATVKSIDFKNVWVIAPTGYIPNAADIELKCDLSNNTESGTYPIEVVLSNNTAWVYGEYNVVVEFTENAQ